jgi:hypothetical protein
MFHLIHAVLISTPGSRYAALASQFVVLHLAWRIATRIHLVN